MTSREPVQNKVSKRGNNCALEWARSPFLYLLGFYVFWNTGVKTVIGNLR